MKTLFDFKFFKWILFLCCGLTFNSSVFASSTFVDSSDAPPGFELTSIRQHLRVSVSFMNRRMGFFFVEISKGKLKFYSPPFLLSQLPNIKKNKTTLSLLSQKFSLHIECSSNGIAAIPDSCQKLKNQAIYVIYNPEKETVYLYMNSSLFESAVKPDTLEFIPNSNIDWSYINKLGATGSYTSNGPIFTYKSYSSTPKYYNLYSNNTLSYKNTSLITNLCQNNGINNGDHFQIQSLYAQHIIQDKIFMGGYIVNTASPFLQSQTLLGLGFTTTLETIKNSDDLMATPLIIFVPQAAQVSIFKNEQLIFSQYLDAGYQRINTSSFPEGGYALTIKVGSNYITQHYFSKGFSLPPENAPQFYFYGGYLTNQMILNDNGYDALPKVLNYPVVQAGIIKRVSPQMAWLSDVLLDRKGGLWDFGPAFFWGNAFVKLAGLVSTNNNYGIYGMFNAQKNNFNINLIATKIFYHHQKPNYYFLNNLIDNDSISLTYSFSERDFVGVQANYTNSIEQPHTYSAGGFYQRELVTYNDMRFFLMAGYNKSIYVGDTYNISLIMNFSQNRFAGTESIGWQDQVNNRDGNKVASPIVAQGATVYSHQNDEGLGYAVNEMHTFSPAVSSLASIYNYTSPKEFISAYVNYNNIKHENQTIGYGGNFETVVAVKRNDVRLSGVDRYNASGIFVRVNTADPTDDFARFALIDGNHRTIAFLNANQQVFVSLPKFTDQDYTLVNYSNSDYLINEPTRHITLYPGNIGYLAWRVEKRIIVIGRVIDKQRRALVNAWIHSGQNGINTDSEGYFQLELTQDTKMLRGDSACRLKLPNLHHQQAYLYIGEAVCS